jgi:hypothetical protein
MREVVVPLVIGVGAGALVGLGVWVFASWQLNRSFQSGSDDLARELGVGSDELARRFEAGREELRRELAAQVESQVVPAVRSEIDAKFRQYNITPETGRLMNQALLAAEALGII